MKNLLSMLLVFSFLFTIGCEDDDATESNPLVGVYNMVSYSVSGDGVNITQDADANNSLTLVFSEGGTYSLQGTIDGDSNSESGAWSTTGGTITFIYEDAEEGTVTDILSYTLSGNNMTMSLTDEGLTITYIWEKE
ncbi:MAG: lipocalin family protein [Candidatus Neomarinimicrobiota bacterium]|nr:lipocalin family protein [Candidatus Neomarinimicrobiota bacterium]